VFLRRHRKATKGVSYDYRALCESVRTPAGPRQRVVAHLGKLTPDERRAKTLTRPPTRALITLGKRGKTPFLPPEPPPSHADR
jgi:hypothetical protein